MIGTPWIGRVCFQNSIKYHCLSGGKQSLSKKTSGKLQHNPGS